MKERLIILAIAMVLIIGILPYNKVRANEDINLLAEKNRPKIIRTRPSNRERYFDSGRLMRKFSDPDEEAYYIEIVFENNDDNLVLVNSLPVGVNLNVEGETGNNLVDKNKNIRITKTLNELRLYIPLLDRPKDGQIYKLTIDEDGLVKYKDGEEEGNYGYEYTFETNYFPKADRLYEGSVPEFYDYNYPIAIDGSSFHRETRVRFSSMDGRTYNADGLTMDRDNKALYVYLPRYPRLPVGLYDIIVSNGPNYEIEIKHGVLSVVEEVNYVANDDQIKPGLGRVEPIVANMVKRSLIGRNIKSNFIEVSGENFDFNGVRIEIPYFESDGKDLKIFRYDEGTRALEEIESKTDFINGSVMGLSQDPGIFVIVE